MNDKKEKKRFYRSMTDFEKEYLPNHYQKTQSEQRNKEAAALGSDFAAEISKSIEQKLK